ncbi:hypothetical protein [Flammeovirga pacifica]|uniref:Uncharacterized protein n=1 Tax=Flammeovirga pacifica TaxID=915059 RepID=A0A1S1YZ87_FLAPC|nr:hypothetical protein [Flammeovirga pacifica]OHX66185.1 hypothetical protein NH26_07390 [Flammeovirga pacifica]
MKYLITTLILLFQINIYGQINDSINIYLPPEHIEEISTKLPKNGILNIKSDKSEIIRIYLKINARLNRELELQEYFFEEIAFISEQRKRTIISVSSEKNDKVYWFTLPYLIYKNKNEIESYIYSFTFVPNIKNLKYKDNNQINFVAVINVLKFLITLDEIESEIFQYLIKVREISSNEINRNSLFIVNSLDTTYQNIVKSEQKELGSGIYRFGILGPHFHSYLLFIDIENEISMHNLTSIKTIEETVAFFNSNPNLFSFEEQLYILKSVVQIIDNRRLDDLREEEYEKEMYNLDLGDEKD